MVSNLQGQEQLLRGKNSPCLAEGVQPTLWTGQLLATITGRGRPTAKTSVAIWGTECKEQ